MYDDHDNGLKAADWALILAGCIILYVMFTALWQRDAVNDAISLRAGVLSVMGAGK